MKSLLINLLLLIYFSYGFAQLSPMVDSIPMTDGKKLAADIYVPDTGTTYPTILVQTPYNRQAYRIIGLPLIKYDIANSNYAFVIVDWRCFYGSLSACILQPDRGLDGADAVNWITSQPWSDGKVGTWGPSALGRVQYMTAKNHPSGLVCAVPLVAGSQYSYQEYFPGGVARTEYIQQLDALGFGLSTVLYQNVVYNSLWSYTENQNYYPDEIQIPMLMIGGWYDHNTRVMIELFNGLTTSSPPNVRSKHRLLMGPWVHGGFGPAQVGSATQGELSYPDAAGWSDSLALVFFDYYLRNQNNGWDASPVVQYFRMGEDEWRNSTTWPPSVLVEDTLFLHENGKLKVDAPDNSSSVSFTYDPKDPSPTHGGSTLRQDLDQGPYDQRQVVESRSDIAIFTTDPFFETVTVVGKPKVTLFVSSDRHDTDFAIRLTDVYPDGRSMLLMDGIFRMRFRDGFTANDTSAMVPGTIYPIDIDLPQTAITFLAGHSLRLDITSSDYPRFDKNLNNGGTMYQAGDTLVAQNTIHYGPDYPSHISLPTTDKINYISNPTNQTALNIFPNPISTDALITLEAAKFDQYPVFALYNIAGRQVENYSITPLTHNTFRLNCGHLENGTYILQLTSGETKACQKIIVNK